MKVLMLKDVPLIGNKGQIKEVKQGYALNYLIPNKLAVLEDQKVVNNFNTQEKAKKDKELIHEELIKKTISEISGREVVIQAKKNDKGKLFKAIHADDIVLAFQKEHNLKIDKNWLPKNLSLKEVGDSKIEINFHNAKAVCVVKIV